MKVISEITELEQKKRIMKNTVQILVVCFLTLLLLTSNNIRIQPENCTILHEGTFEYGNSDFEVKVVIKGNKHTEFHANGKYIIKSKINWVSDCEYNMTMTKITIPNFPYKAGDIMNVKINKIEGKDIYYTSTVKGNSWAGKLTKIE